jgi:quercetin dioxygenase-like cupin family protein
MLPFKQKVEGTSKIRTFKNDVDPNELKWHWDECDRVVTILEGNGWQFQFEDEFPFTISKGDVINIEEGRYHRVIVGSTDLIVKIEE